MQLLRALGLSKGGIPKRGPALWRARALRARALRARGPGARRSLTWLVPQRHLGPSEG